MNKTWEYTG